MPAIWSSSERPISVRTVWVDGIRHAILSPDDPFINSNPSRRPRTSKEKSYLTKYQHLQSRLDHLNNCFRDLNVVVENGLSEKKKSPRILRRQSAPTCSTILSDTSENILDFSLQDNNKIGDYKDHRLTEEDVVNIYLNEPTIKNEKNQNETPEPHRESKLHMMKRKESEETLDTYFNPLSERVLQWLDLSGKAHDYDFKNDNEDSPRFDEEEKWSSFRRRVSLLKRESYSSKGHIVVQNYRLYKEHKSEYIEMDEKKMLQKRLPKIKDIKDDGYREISEQSLSSVSLPIQEGTERKVLSNVNKDESKNEVVLHGNGSSSWSPPGRLQLHIVMPNLHYREKDASSEESLMCD